MTTERAVTHTVPGVAATVSGQVAINAPLPAGEASVQGWG
jgi:hypothetical protein